ncbi:MAG: RlpA-like double-psi beta-barrel domain-containing protein [Anaplasma sp.]
MEINDRRPFVENRIIDLSKKAATTLGFRNKGTAKVSVLYLDRCPRECCRRTCDRVRYARLVRATGRIWLRRGPLGYGGYGMGSDVC